MMRTFSEKPLTFPSGDHRLFGILHEPHRPAEAGIVILVGGPQYRVGSHRMFVQMARRLAADGYAVLRFDFSGMGDSGGTFPGFEALNEDVAAAIRQLCACCPSVRRVVLLGLCDGATAAAYYAPNDQRVWGVALLNPWVHTESGEAATFLWHYYPRRLLQRDFWRALIRRETTPARALSNLLETVRKRVARRAPQAQTNFVERMREALAAFEGRVLVAASENDYTALQFLDLWRRDERWQGILDAARFVRLEGADHTLSSRTDLEAFCAAVALWIGLAVPERADTEPLRA